MILNFKTLGFNSEIIILALFITKNYKGNQPMGEFLNFLYVVGMFMIKAKLRRKRLFGLKKAETWKQNQNVLTECEERKFVKAKPAKPRTLIWKTAETKTPKTLSF